MAHLFPFAAVLLLATQPLYAESAVVEVPVIGLPCQGCDEVFIRMPDRLSSQARIAATDQPGQALSIEGVVRDQAGKVAAGVIVYAYHTDADGIYPNANRTRGASGSRHGDLRGWARTDAQGRYRFDTIRPASYPDTAIPQHVHMHIIEPDCCTYYIDDIVFTDDPLLTERARNAPAKRGGRGVVTPIRDAQGVWSVTRDIVLGQGIADYGKAKGR
ncbi:MAG: hypothetical protein KDI71_14760 [Xanthomonadales bacterium]|nr:hypothetical protein [Xanthomonadales bacterium]